MLVRSHCFTRASWNFPTHLVQRSNSTVLLDQTRLFHSSSPKQSKKSNIERVDTVAYMIGRIRTWLEESDEVYQLVMTTLDNTNTRRVLHANPKKDSTFPLKRRIANIQKLTVDIKPLIIEVIEFKVNRIVGKIRPKPQDELQDPWLQEKSIERWKIMISKSKAAHAPYIPNSVTSTQYNMEILKANELHRHIALLLESQRLRLEAMLRRTASYCNYVSYSMDILLCLIKSTK
ncbi:hypothetical protein F5B19DRAFT_471388 [Rostrohypoxylon terebratum]|nr:hypothetical protein F5B19DRAFT_471388 [Rostrohypoxylon terebratum]